jgi:hypothetical protein
MAARPLPACLLPALLLLGAGLPAAADTGGADGTDGTGGTDGTAGTDGTDGTVVPSSPIEGSWTARGRNVAAVYSPGATDSVTAVFTSDGAVTFSGSALGAVVSGTYTVDGEGSAVSGITVSTGSSTYAGIWQIQGSTLLLELPLSASTADGEAITAPTLDGGFSSTQVGGAASDDYVHYLTLAGSDTGSAVAGGSPASIAGEAGGWGCDAAGGMGLGLWILGVGAVARRRR